jgi:hypothetical protein
MLKLHKHLPPHLAFNAALLIRGLRPVVQLDTQDEQHTTRTLDAFEKAIRVASGRKVHHLSTDMGTVCWLDGRLPADVRHALRKLESAVGKDVVRWTGEALRLVCGPRDAADHTRFRVLLGVTDMKGDAWFFKQQMCTRPDQISRIYGEMQKYVDLADEMGFLTTELRVVRVQPRHNALNA